MNGRLGVTLEGLTAQSECIGANDECETASLKESSIPWDWCTAMSHIILKDVVSFEIVPRADHTNALCFCLARMVRICKSLAY